MNNYIMVTTTFDNLKEANLVTNLLLEKRLVSCCQFLNITSAYHWKGEIERADEILVQMKSKKNLYSEIEKVILENHSYETPQIVYYDISGGYNEYLKWIGDETK